MSSLSLSQNKGRVSLRCQKKINKILYVDIMAASKKYFLKFNFPAHIDLAQTTLFAIKTIIGRFLTKSEWSYATNFCNYNIGATSENFSYKQTCGSNIAI